MKRNPLLYLIIAITILGMMLAACQPGETATQAISDTPVGETTTIPPTSEPREPPSEEHPIQLRIGVTMTATELETFLPLISAIDEAHPEWIIVLEQTPQASQQEKLMADAAAGTLPDVREIFQLDMVTLARTGALLPLEDFISASNLDMEDFFPGFVQEFTYEGSIYALPYVGAPGLLMYNIEKFDAAGLSYPTSDWTFDDLREAAIRLTLDENGRNPTDPGFDPNSIVQWGYGGSPAPLGVWAAAWVEPWGSGFCVDVDCTQVSMTDPDDLEALNFWYDLVVNQHAAIVDQYSGAQTGMPGDPFGTGFAAMSFAGYYVIGEMRDAGAFRFGIAEPPMGPAGRRSDVSLRGYVIGGNSEYPEEAWKLILELTSPEFLRNMWAIPGHSVPARRTAAQGILEMQNPVENLDVVLRVMEYVGGYRPSGPGSFEAYMASSNIALEVFNGGLSVEEGYAQMEEEVNRILREAAQ